MKKKLPFIFNPRAKGNIIILHDQNLLNFKDPFDRLRRFSTIVDNPNPAKELLFLKDKFNLDSNSIIVVLHLIVDPKLITPLISFIKKQNIRKIYFFIWDVFRLHHPKKRSFEDTTVLYKDSKNVKVIDLETIDYIVKSCNIDYEIYHCEKESNFLSKNYNLNNIKYFDIFSLNHCSLNLADREFKNTFTYKICCLNRRHEIHRTYIASLLHDQHNVLVSLNHRYKFEYILHNTEIPLNNFAAELKTKILSNYTNILENHIHLTLDSKYTDTTTSPFVLDEKFEKKPEEYIRDSFLNVVTETRFCSPMPSFCEKTLDSIRVFRPFILLAPPNTLKLLKDLGFQTFNRWWDEGYDSIENHNNRFAEVYKIICSILEKDFISLHTMLEEMKSVLEHNQQHLKELPERMFNFSRFN